MNDSEQFPKAGYKEKHMAASDLTSQVSDRQYSKSYAGGNIQNVIPATKQKSTNNDTIHRLHAPKFQNVFFSEGAEPPDSGRQATTPRTARGITTSGGIYLLYLMECFEYAFNILS